MRITSDQLVAIEKVIGHNAKVSIESNERYYRHEMIFSVQFELEGQSKALHNTFPVSQEVPFHYIARSTIRQVQGYIQDFYFKGVFK